MDQKQIAKQMIEFGQTTFNTAFDANLMLQEQFERVTQAVLDQAAWLPPEGRKAIDSWAAALKNGRQDFKKYVDRSYQQAQEIVSEIE